MDLSEPQKRRLWNMTDEQLGVEILKHVHRNPVEEAYHLGCQDMLLIRLLQKVNQLADNAAPPSPPLVEKGHDVNLDNIHEQILADQAEVQPKKKAKA